MALGHTAKIASLTVAMIAIAIGATGCKILEKVAKTQKHAAIAYDEKTGGWGYSYDKLTEDLAKKTATEKCPHCTVRLTWNQGCGALAQSKTKKDVMSTATGTTRLAAEGAAKAECVKNGGGTCEVLIYACNSTG